MSISPNFEDIKQAYERIKGDVKKTPIMESSLLNKWMGNRILFKAECLQTIGAFKIRGAMNFLARLKEEGRLPKHVVANSSGNHAQAVAYAAAHFGIKATIFASETISPIKAAATQSYGAELKLFPTRPEADAAVEQASKAPDTVWIPPFNHKDIVAGQGTATLEALNDIALDYAPNTLADGAATPSVGDVTFPILQEIDDFYEVDELQIAYWTQWLHHLLKLHIEPTCAMTMAAVAAWAANTPPGQTALVILSGGNISQSSMAKIWERDFLLQPPILDLDDEDELEETERVEA